ncbi:MAG: hypothetical protein QG673_168 [Pseudomonadota bacterium]|nr:hypothetical protein [Pseudomonadota bacterium]
MSKNKALRKYEPELTDSLELDADFDFEEDAHIGDGIAGIMNGLIETSNHQATIAMELTKLVVAKNPQAMTEDKIFSAYERAFRTVSDNSPLKSLLEQCG